MPQHTYPLGSLVFGVLDLDAAPLSGTGPHIAEKIPGRKLPGRSDHAAEPGNA